MDSILTDKVNECMICGRPREAWHHVFGGPNRNLSERFGLKIPLCHAHHNMSNYSVHFDRELDISAKRMAQRTFEEKYSHQYFMQVFGKNYL